MAASETVLTNSPDINQLQLDSEREIQQAIRDETGRFLPGSTGNPDGRPKCTLISDRLKQVLSSEDASGRTGADKIGDKLMRMTQQEKDEWLALAAIKEVTDRVEGKAVQNTNVRGLIVMMPADDVIKAAFDAPEPE